MPRTEATLTGSESRCQCPNCGEFFSTTGNFDKHRKGTPGVDRVCVDPESVGLRIKETKAGTFWAMPGPVNHKWRSDDKSD